MKNSCVYICSFVIFILCLSSTQVKSQELEYNSEEELVYDITSRRVDKPILFLSRQIKAIENNEIPLNDEEYVNYVSLLSTCFVINNQPNKSDSILSHSIDYLQQIEKTSNIYLLQYSYGTLFMTVENYSLAAQHFEMAIDEMRKQNMTGDNLGVVISMLSVCHMNVGRTGLAVSEIEEAIAIIESTEIEQGVSNQRSIYHKSNLLGIYQKAGGIYYEHHDIKHAIEYTRKAYDLSKNDDANIAVFMNAARNLGVMCLNDGDYTSALVFLHEIEGSPMFESEKAKVFSDILLAYYHLENEDECIKYAQLCSNSIKRNVQQFYTSFSGTTIEDIWYSSAMQLKLNMGVLKKFPHNAQAAQMSYDNALFTKRLLYDRMAYLRSIAKANNAIDTTITEIKQLRADLFGGDTSVYEKLNRKERSLIEQLNSLNKPFSSHLHHWQEISEALGENECAIETISYTGWPKNENEEMDLRLGALILSRGAAAPIFVDICSQDSLHHLILKALSQQEIGINDLYTTNSEYSLYNLIWSPIEPFIKSAKRIYYSPILELQNVNLRFILCPDGTFVQDRYDLHIVSSTAIICDKTERIEGGNASLYGGISYSRQPNVASPTAIRGLLNELTNSQDRGSFGYLSASNREVDVIDSILRMYQYQTNLLKGIKANEISFRELDGTSPTILHLSTHGFYLVGFDKFTSYFERLIPYSQSNSDMIKSGLLLADANSSLNFNNSPALVDGVLTAEEISWMDFSNTQLVVLSACETAIGQSFQEGFGGLIRAFKMAGVQHVIASLWKVPDEATADLMVLFYKNLISGLEPHGSLIRAQREMSLRYPDPYYWAAFIMVD